MLGGLHELIFTVYGLFSDPRGLVRGNVRFLLNSVNHLTVQAKLELNGGRTVSTASRIVREKIMLNVNNEDRSQFESQALD